MTIAGSPAENKPQSADEGPSAPRYAQLIRRINRIAHDRPALGLRLAAAAGFVLGRRLGSAWTPSTAEVVDLLGDVGARRVVGLQRRIASGELRNRALLYVLKNRGPEPILPLVELRGIDGFQRLQDARVPLVVVFWHQGVVRSTGTALAKLGQRILVAALQAPRGPDPGFPWRTVDNARSGTAFLMAALKELKQGGVPVLALDGGAGPNHPRVPFFDRSIWVPPGPAILARRGGARIVPATSRWVGASAGIEVTLHEPVPEPVVDRSERARWEQELLTSTSLWFERHLRAHPGDMRPLNFRESYRGLPPAELAADPL